MSPTLDPKASVFEGRAGSGDAFLLGDAWKTPLAQGNQYLREDAHAAARAAAAKAAQDAEQQKANNKALADLLNIDTSKAWDIDQPDLVNGYNDIITYTQQQLAAGKNPGDPRNTEQWAEVQRRTKELGAHAAASMQQAERWKNIATLIANDKDGIWKGREVGDELAVYRAAPLAERLKMEISPKRFINREKLVASTTQGLLHEIEKAETQTANPNGFTHLTATERLTPQQIQQSAGLILSTQGVADQLQDEYNALPEPVKAANPNVQAWKEATVRQEVINALGSFQRDPKTGAYVRVVKDNTSYHKPAADPRPAAADRKFDTERSDRNQAVTTLVGQYNQLRNGDPALFTSFSEKYPGLQQSNVFTNGIEVGKFETSEKYTDAQSNVRTKNETKPNIVLGVFRDPDNGKLFMETSESTRKKGAERLIELTDANAYDMLLSKVDKDKDLRQVLTRGGFLKPGTATLDLARLGNPVTPEQVEQQRAAASSHRAELVKKNLARAADLFDDTKKYPGLNPADESITDFAKGKAPTQVMANRINDELVKGSLKTADGKVLQQPRVIFSKKNPRFFGDAKTEAYIDYTEGGQKKRLGPLPANELKTLLTEGFTLSPRKAAAAPTTRRADAAAVRQSTTATTSTRTSKTSNSASTGGAY